MQHPSITTESVKRALRAYDELQKLAMQPLCQLNVVEKRCLDSGYGELPLGKARALQEILSQAIDLLGSNIESSDVNWAEPPQRYYAILTLKYVERLKHEAIMDMVLLSGGRYYDEHRNAIEALVAVLQEMEGVPNEQQPLQFPGGAIAVSDGFYIRRQADEILQMEVAAAGCVVTIRGSRQMGKTSLMFRGINHISSQADAYVTHFDLQGIGIGDVGSGIDTLDAFLYEIGERMADTLGLPIEVLERAWRTRRLPQTKLERFIENHILPKVEGRIVLALDEVDRLFFTAFRKDFFSFLRSLHNKKALKPEWRKLDLIQVISTEPYLLIEDPHQSPFNVGVIISLSDFSLDQVRACNLRYGSPLTDREVNELFRLVNGHPYLTRVALYTIARDRLIWPEFATAAVQADGGPFNDHLRASSREIEKSDGLISALKMCIAGDDCLDANACLRLLKAGLVRKEGEHYIIRCELYRNYFSEMLT